MGKRMALRSWLIRGTILTVLAVLAVGGWIASDWVSPEAVRTKVVAHLHDRLQGVDIQVESARMRIFGGIAITNLRLARQGDPADKPFLVVPSAVLFHDKEQLNRGRLVIRKIELDNAEIRLERNADGEWNLTDVLRPSPSDKPIPLIPTIVARTTTLHFSDLAPNGMPAVTLSQARFTILNDPLPMVNVEAQAAAGVYGPLTLRARFNRVSKQVSVGVDLSDVPVNETTAEVALRYAPDLAPVLSKLTARAAVSADLTFTPGTTPPLRHDVRVTVKDGRFAHDDMPWPLEKLEASARLVDGSLKVEKASAQAGPVMLDLSLETRDRTEASADLAKVSHTTAATTNSTIPANETRAANNSYLSPIEDYLRTLKITARGIPLDEALCNRLPGETPQKMRRMFKPEGSVDVSYEFSRDAGGWKRETEFRPKNLGFLYEKFRYPVAEVRGWVRRTLTSSGQDSTLLKLHGMAGGQPISIEGQVYGDDDDPAVNLRIAGTNVPLDETFISALPGRYPSLVRQFHVGGRGDFVAEIRQPLGVNLLENSFTIDLRDATVNYSQFPYPLEKVKGRVIVRTTATDAQRPMRPGEEVRKMPDRDEFMLQEFSGVHAGGTIQLHGSKRPIPHSVDKKLMLHIHGNACPVDADLRRALAAIKLDSVWTTFSPTGKLTFSTDVEILDRGAAQPEPLVRAQEPSDKNAPAIVSAPANAPGAEPRPLTPEVPFDPITDLKLSFNFYGPTVTPDFFPYTISELTGWLEYKAGKLDLGQFTARHGETRLKLNAADVRFYPDGVVWANLGGLELKPFVADAELLKALPRKIRGPVEEMKLKGSAELMVKHLVVLTPPDHPGAAKPPALMPLPPGSTSAVVPNQPGETTGANRNMRGGIVRGQAPAMPVSALTPAPPEDPDPVFYWDSELRLLNASLEVGAPWDDAIGAVATRGRYEGTHLGQVRGNMWFDQVSIAKQPVTRAKVTFSAPAQAPDPMRAGQFLPPRFEFQDINATLFHGSVGGEARVVLDSPARFEVWLTATDVQLDEVARHYQLGSDADLKGVAQAQIWFANRPDAKTGVPALVGEGTLDVPAGRMYNLPVLLDLVKVLKLQAPDKTAFEEAHARFSLQGDRVRVEQLDLIGAAVCLGGSGELDMRGDFVRFEFYTIWSQLLKRWLTTPVGDITAFFSRNLFKIKMTRKDGTLTYEGEVVPLVTEPVKNILERVRRNAGRLRDR